MEEVFAVTKVQAVLNMVGKASHHIILQNLIRYLDRDHLPAFYVDPQQLPAEFKKALNTLMESSSLLSSPPYILEETQIYAALDVDREAAGSYGNMKVTGRLRVFMDKMLQPTLEESFTLHLNAHQAGSCQRALWFHGENIGTRQFPLKDGSRLVRSLDPGA